MRFALLRSIITFAIVVFVLPSGFAQTPEPSQTDAVRVSVTYNRDGSRTVYEFDNEHHKATATTTEPDGKVRGKVRYELDGAGRFSSGLVFGPDEKFRFKSIYKYDAAGRLEQETQLGKDDSVQHKVVYKYNPVGQPIGYSVFDAAGKPIGGKPATKPTPSPKPRNALGR
jgi:hypothetical protein